MTIAANFASIQSRIEAASKTRTRSLDRVVQLIAVSKGQTVDAIAELYNQGQRDFGENYVQELTTKAQELSERGFFEIRWHFIGHLQSNKAKQLAPWVSSVHSLDSESTAKELGKRWLALKREEALPVFLEVNIDREKEKSGVSPDDAVKSAREIGAVPGLELRGLMCVPKAHGPGYSNGHSESAFSRLRDLEQKCRPFTQGDLSMGMSGDFENAIAEGATHVRVGTSLFGPRPAKP
jgi:pyridoxal phosphate enzyme (YggS family)